MKTKYRKSIKRIISGGLCAFSMLMITACGMMAQIPLDKPENVRVTEITDNHALVSWDRVANAFDYEVRIFKEDGTAGDVYNFPSEPRVEYKELEWDESYTVIIKPRASGTIWDKYTFGETASVTFKTDMPVEPEGQFARPKNVKAVYDSKTKTINVSWDKVEGAAFYEVKCEYFMIDPNGVERILEDITQGVEAPDTSFVDNWINVKKLKDVRKVFYTVWSRDERLEGEKNKSKKAVVRIEE